jgi:hypothetical protein
MDLNSPLAVALGLVGGMAVVWRPICSCKRSSIAAINAVSRGNRPHVSAGRPSIGNCARSRIGSARSRSAKRNAPGTGRIASAEPRSRARPAGAWGCRRRMSHDPRLAPPSQFYLSPLAATACVGARCGALRSARLGNTDTTARTAVRRTGSGGSACACHARCRPMGGRHGGHPPLSPRASPDPRDVRSPRGRRHRGDPAQRLPTPRGARDADGH